jgi:hypothetical protein
VPFACALVLYFVAPYRLGAAITLNVRMAPIVALLAVPLLDPGDGPSGRWALALASVAALLAPIVNGFEIRRIDIEEAVEPGALFAKAQPGKRLAALNFRTKSPRTHFAPWPHLGAYYRLGGGGVASWSFSEMHHWSLHYVPEAAPPAHGAFWEFNPCVFRNAVDGPYYDYVLVRGHVDPFKDKPPGPAWRSIAHQRDYTLYEKTGDEWPPRDAPPGDEGPCKGPSAPP